MSPTAMHQSSGSSAQPSSKVRRDRRQEQGDLAYWPSYLSSQWEMCSMEMDWLSVGMAFSTGMTCIPMPAPPGGTMGVTRSRASKLMRSKNLPSSGCSSSCFAFMLVNSALPGTNRGRTYRFSWLGFLPSRFSQLYSMRPTMHISNSSFSRYSGSLPVSLAIWERVLGLRTSIFRATSAISSVTMPWRPQYSASS